MVQFTVTQDCLPSGKRLRAALSGLQDTAPIVIMIHGFKYDPYCPRADAANHIFALNPAPSGKRAASWPRRLGLRGPDALAIGFGWRARGTIWQAHRKASYAAVQLAELITQLRTTSPDRPIHIVAHSLGARVALSALSQSPTQAIHRVILIAAAAFERELYAAVKTPAGQTAEIINIRSRANTAFDLLLRAALPHWGRTLGRGPRGHNILDIGLDDPATIAALRVAGFTMHPVGPRVCHWSGYLRHDACALYRALLHRPSVTPLPYLQGLLRQGSDHKTAIAPSTGLSFRHWMPF